MCDTFVDRLDGGGWLFAKNSDREANEAQVLEYVPAATHPVGSHVDCTYVTIPQVPHTHGLVLSRPFWMWGAEMGVNDVGVAIGNEAVWTKEPLSKEPGLTGMDILRLTLERARSASAAVDIITLLLEEHGQGGVCGFADTSMAYHNSFLVADNQEAWVVETAGSYWGAQRVESSYAISNGLTLGAKLDKVHPGAESHARDRRFIRAGEPFEFARAYSDFIYTTFSACKRRRDAASSATTNRDSKADPRTWAFATLRDHGGSHPLADFRSTSICAHAANGLTRNASQTTGSLVALLRPGISPEIWATGTSAPCTGVFKPLDLNQLPSNVGVPGAQPDSSLWWRHEAYHRRVNADFAGRLHLHESERETLEREFIANHPGAGSSSLPQYLEECFSRADEALDRWVTTISESPRRSPTHYWRKLNRQVGLDI